MNLNAVLDIILPFLEKNYAFYAGSEIKGYLRASDPRLRPFLASGEGSRYEHSAMPLLDLQLNHPLVVRLSGQNLNFTHPSRRLMFYHDALWLLRSLSSVREAFKIPYSNIYSVEVRLPTAEESASSDIDSYLDRL